MFAVSSTVSSRVPAHCQYIIKPSPNKAFMFEIMCSKESELTRQGMQQGLTVKRFGLAEGDLRTKSGRRNLFCHLARDRPKHWWISPTCGPWCLRSNFNMSKNAELRQSILTQRKENIWQVSLSHMLCLKGPSCCDCHVFNQLSM